jgi:PleD family two-component response regulator
LLVEISVKTTDGPGMQEINTSLFQARLDDISNIHNRSHFKARILKTTNSALQAGTP